MKIKQLNVLNFKNYEELSLVPNPQINCIVGLNGSGKTNLLDAIHCLCLSKSSFHLTDTQLTKHDTPFYMVKASFDSENGETSEVLLSFKQRQKKSLKLNGVPYEKITSHIGKYPLVLVTPNDTDLVREGSEIRRRLIDGIISQTNPGYLLSLVRYNKLLKERNALLKSFKVNRHRDYDLLSTFDEQLLPLNQKLHSDRVSFMTFFLPVFQKTYKDISQARESVTLNYSSQLSSDQFETDYKNAIDKDVILERTTKGIHRDDLLFSIDNEPLKKFGSQGQQKTFVLALQLAKLDFLKSQLGITPLLLLDDIFDKLDEDRIKEMLKIVQGDGFGQIFITDASPERTLRIVKALHLDYSIFEIVDGELADVQEEAKK